ncbi:MAG: hypothetical protein Q7J27_10840, partial [Syntrophales bacterium]|nr:hypothetical protein [Syntrophales bacterium]
EKFQADGDHVNAGQGTLPAIVTAALVLGAPFRPQGELTGQRSCADLDRTLDHGVLIGHGLDKALLKHGQAGLKHVGSAPVHQHLTGKRNHHISSKSNYSA